MIETVAFSPIDTQTGTTTTLSADSVPVVKYMAPPSLVTRSLSKFTVNGRVITINELTIRQIMDLKNVVSGSDPLDGMQKLLCLLTDATPDFLLDLTPSEMKALYGWIEITNAELFTVLSVDGLLTDCRNLMATTVKEGLSSLCCTSLPESADPVPEKVFLKGK